MKKVRSLLIKYQQIHRPSINAYFLESMICGQNPRVSQSIKNKASDIEKNTWLVTGAFVTKLTRNHLGNWPIQKGSQKEDNSADVCVFVLQNMICQLIFTDDSDYSWWTSLINDYVRSIVLLMIKSSGGLNWNHVVWTNSFDTLPIRGAMLPC